MIALLNSVVSVYYYLGVLVAMYNDRGNGRDRAAVVAARTVPATILIAAGATLVIGIHPPGTMDVARLSLPFGSVVVSAQAAGRSR